MGSPYRELPKYLLCPRCGEMLSRELDGVSTCLRCEGMWIASEALDAAFGDPHWPPGQAQWWRNALDCPICGFEGKHTQMTARMADTVVVDQCAAHGVWLDRGELGRLMGTAGDELAALRERLQVAEPELERLGMRRGQWRADLEARRRIAAEYHQAQDDEQRRRAAITEAERLRRDGERERERATEREREHARRPHDQAHEREARQLVADDEARRSARLHDLGNRRAQAAAEIGRLEIQLGGLREHVQRLDAELTRTRYRASAIECELDAARDRMRQLDSE